MTAIFEVLLGRLPIGWLQLMHRKTRFAAAITGVAFASLLVFFQLGFLGALSSSVVLPYASITADILLSGPDSRTLAGGAPIPRQRVYDALSVPDVDFATPLFVGQVPFDIDGQPDLTLTVFGVEPDALARFWEPAIAKDAEVIELTDVALVDRMTRFISPALIERIENGTPPTFESNGSTLAIAGTFAIGAGFESDGYLMVSDQTFLRLFPGREAGAPTHVMVKLSDNADQQAVLAELQQLFPASQTLARSLSDAATAEQRFQTVERPVGIIFGFGAIMGVMVGLVIVYQVLSTEVSDHMREYATLKAIGYRNRYFSSIVLEEATILGVAGFIPGALIATLIYGLLASTTGLPMAMTQSRLIGVFVGTLLACIVSGLLATRRLAAADPADLY